MRLDGPGENAARNSADSSVNCKLVNVEERAKAALADAERRMEGRLNTAIEQQHQRHQEAMRVAVNAEHLRCRRLAVQSFHAALGQSVLMDGSAAAAVDVLPVWADRCLFCLDHEPLFGRKECSHVSLCGPCSIVWSGEDEGKCLTCQQGCETFAFFGPNPSPEQ